MVTSKKPDRPAISPPAPDHGLGRRRTLRTAEQRLVTDESSVADYLPRRGRPSPGLPRHDAALSATTGTAPTGRSRNSASEAIKLIPHTATM